MAVVALPHEIEVEAKAVHMHFLRARQGEAAARWVRRVVDVERLAATVARGDALDLERQKAGDHGRALQTIEIQFYGLKGDAAETSAQVLGLQGGGPPRLPADDCGERLTLRLIRAFVDNTG